MYLINLPQNLAFQSDFIPYMYFSLTSGRIKSELQTGYSQVCIQALRLKCIHFRLKFAQVDFSPTLEMTTRRGPDRSSSSSVKDLFLFTAAAELLSTLSAPEGKPAEGKLLRPLFYSCCIQGCYDLSFNVPFGRLTFAGSPRERVGSETVVISADFLFRLAILRFLLGAASPCEEKAPHYLRRWQISNSRRL